MAFGRPRTYDNPEEMQAVIDTFFESGEKKTVTGLAFWLGFESRQSIYDYKENGDFSYIIKRALLKVEINYEELLQGQAVAGSIFALKNMGWQDTQTVNQKHSGNVGNTYVLLNSPTNEQLPEGNPG